MKVEVIQKAQAALFAMAKDIDILCRKHDITYWIDGGSILGAVRNGGFIPWDDDIDFCFLVDDFHRLRKAIKEDLIPNNPKYILYNDHRPFQHYSEYLADTSLVKNKFYPVKIDLLKMKTLPNTPEAIQKDKDWVNLLSFLFNKSNKLEVKDKDLLRESLVSGSFLFRRERFNNKFITYIDSLNQVEKSNIFSYPYNDMYVAKTREYYTYDDIFPVQEIEFEGVKFLAPNNTDAYLTKLYGKNYLTPPPIEKQVSLSKSLGKSPFSRGISKQIIWLMYFLKAIKNSFTLISKIKKNGPYPNK
jgi:lipopolysaccharide cholinephosphotransferase